MKLFGGNFKELFDYLDEKTVKEVLKKIIENNNNIPYKAKAEIKAIIELEHNPEKLLQECLLYMLSYKG